MLKFVIVALLSLTFCGCAVSPSATKAESTVETTKAAYHVRTPTAQMNELIQVLIDPKNAGRFNSEVTFSGGVVTGSLGLDKRGKVDFTYTTPQSGYRTKLSLRVVYAITQYTDLDADGSLDLYQCRTCSWPTEGGNFQGEYDDLMIEIIDTVGLPTKN